MRIFTYNGPGLCKKETRAVSVRNKTSLQTDRLVCSYLMVNNLILFKLAKNALKLVEKC